MLLMLGIYALLMEFIAGDPLHPVRVVMRALKEKLWRVAKGEMRFGSTYRCSSPISVMSPCSDGSR